MIESSPEVAETIDVSARGEHVAPSPAPPIIADMHISRSAFVATANGTTIGIMIANVVQPPPIANAVPAQSTNMIAGVITGGIFPWNTEIMNCVMPSPSATPPSVQPRISTRFA